MAQFLIVTVGISPFEFYICILIFTFVNTATEYFVSYPWLKIITQIIKHNLGNRMLGQARPNSITQVMIYRGRGTGEAGEACASPEFRGFTTEKFLAS